MNSECKQKMYRSFPVNGTNQDLLDALSMPSIQSPLKTADSSSDFQLQQIIRFYSRQGYAKSIRSPFGIKHVIYLNFIISRMPTNS